MQGRSSDKAASGGGVRLRAAAVSPFCVGHGSELGGIYLGPIVELVHGAVGAYGEHQAGVVCLDADGPGLYRRNLHCLVGELLGLGLFGVCRDDCEHYRRYEGYQFHSAKIVKKLLPMICLEGGHALFKEPELVAVDAAGADAHAAAAAAHLVQAHGAHAVGQELVHKGGAAQAGIA